MTWQKTVYNGNEDLVYLPWERKGVPFGFDIFDEAISRDQCNELIEWFENKAVFNRSVVIKNGETAEDDVRTSDSISFPFMSYDLPDFVTAINKTVWNHIIDYGTEMGVGVYGVENPSIQRYRPGQYYKVHSDYGNSNNRVFSVLLYLNDVYEGGQTYFPYQDFSIEPRAGRLALFPSNYMWPHEAKPPINSTKYAAAYWVKG